MSAPFKFTTSLFAILAAVVMCLQSVVVVSSVGAAPMPTVACRHCCANRQSGQPMASCCAQRSNAQTPAAPATPPSQSQNDLQVLTVSIVSVLSLPIPSANFYPAVENFSRSACSLPLFQRDCCYLL